MWKYFDHREDWTDPRSYVLERAGAVVAHVGLWPVVLTRSARGCLKGVQMIDWVAARNAAGAGLTLVRHLSAMFDFIYSIGGSEETQRLLPAFGFREETKTWIGARPLRALSPIRSRHPRNWKLVPRLVRNCAWALYPPVRIHGWSVTAVTPQQIPPDLVAALARETHSLPRPPEFFDYLLRCPEAAFDLYLVCDPIAPRALLLISEVRLQSRVAGLWLRDPDRAAWSEVYALAQRAAAEKGRTCEIVAKGTRGRSGDAAVSSGLRLFAEQTVYALSETQEPLAGLEFQWCDDDWVFRWLGYCT